MTSLNDFKFLLGLFCGLLLSAFAVAFRKQIEKLFEVLLSKIPIAISKAFRYRRWEKKYRKVIYEEHKDLRYVGVRSNTTLYRPKLEEVYVSLEIQAAPISKFTSSKGAAGLAETLGLDVALKKFTHLVILGHPGAGKTTVFDYLVCICCRSDGRSSDNIKRLLPIFVPLRRCSFVGRSLTEELTDSSTRLLPPDLLRTYPQGFFDHYLAKGKCILLFDGLDEVLNEDDHVAAARMVETTAAIFNKCPVLVNSRLAGWRNLLGSQFVRFVIQELSQRDVEGLVRQWYLAVVGQQVWSGGLESISTEQRASSSRIAIEQAESMLAILKGAPRLMQIATTPLILSLMCLVFYTRQDLPKKRARLYEDCVNILLEEWDRREKQIHFSGMPSLQQKIALLERVATVLFANYASEISKEELERELEAFLKDTRLELSVTELLHFIEERSGLISEKALGVYGFTHLTFQEYFAATGLKRSTAGLETLLERFSRTEIEETVLLYAGVIERGDDLIGRLLNSYEASNQIRFLIAAGRAMSEARDLGLELKARVTELLSFAFESSADPTLSIIQGILSEFGIKKEIIRKFNEFDIVSEIGRGGAGTVYRARERANGRQVALKVYQSRTNRQLEWIQSEMSTLRALKHPNLVETFALGTSGDQLFISMELMEAPSLEAIVKELEEHGSVPGVPTFGTGDYYHWVKSVMTDVCLAVSYLHVHHIIHGDIKPANILHKGAVSKLLDFGIDMLVERAVIQDTDTFSRTIMSIPFLPGTMGYMGPERLREIDRVGPASDVYSLGMVLNVLCTLSTPRWQQNPVTDKQRGWKSRLRFWRTESHIVEGVSPDASRIIVRATAYQPEDRYASVDDMLRDIRQAELEW